MKTPLVTLLLLSLAGNAALAFSMLRSGPAEVTITAAMPATATVQAASSATEIPASPPVSPAGWQTLMPDQNLRKLVANLRASGFPPSVVRAMATQMVADQLSGAAAVGHLPFWKQNSNNPEYVTALQQVSNQRREMLTDLLGADARPSVVMDPVTRERRYGQLSDEKIDRIEALTRDYSELRAKLMATRKPGDTTGAMSSQLAVEQDQRAELATILTPDELEQYEMRNSTSATRLMASLKSVDVSEAEYTALFRAQQAFDAADPFRAGVMNSGSMVLRNAAQEKLNEAARAVLTDDRFYDYLLGADSSYARSAQFTANHPDITAAMTYALTRLEREYQTATMSMSQAGAGGPPSADRMARITAARTNYQDKLNALLGPEVAAAYAQRNRTGATIAPASR